MSTACDSPATCGLANAAIFIARLKGRFAHVPQVNRHYAAKQDETLRGVLRPGSIWCAVRERPV